MMTGPASILILNPVEISRDLFIPLFPFLAAFDDQTFADIHITEEFLAAVGAETGNKLLFIQFFYNRFTDLP